MKYSLVGNIVKLGLYFFFNGEKQRVQTVFVFNEQWRERAIYPQDIKPHEWSTAAMLIKYRVKAFVNWNPRQSKNNYLEETQTYKMKKHARYYSLMDKEGKQFSQKFY